MHAPVAGLDEVVDDLGVAGRPGVQGFQAALRFRPVEGDEIVFGAEQRGGVDGRTLEHGLVQLAVLHEAEQLGQRARGRVGLQPLHGARGEDEHAVRGLPAQHFLPGIGDDIELVPLQRLGEGGRGGVADRDSITLGADPVRVRHAHAGRGAVPGEDDVAIRLRGGQVRQLAIFALERAQIIQIQLFDGVGDPVLAEGLPREDVHAALPQHGPHGQLHRAGVGTGDDGDAVRVRHLQHLARAVDGALELGLGRGRAVIAAQRGVLQLRQGPALRLARWAGRKARIFGFDGRLWIVRHGGKAYRGTGAGQP